MCNKSGALNKPKKKTYQRYINPLNNMLRKICIIIGVVAFVLIATPIIGNRMTKSELDKDIEKLFAVSEIISGKVYTSSKSKTSLYQFKDISSIHWKTINHTLAMQDCNTVVNSEQSQIKSGCQLKGKNISQRKSQDLFG